jgi:hypothetical protein
MKKICLIFGLGLALFTTANAHSPKTEPKTDGKTSESAKTKDEDDVTSWYQYVGPQPGTTAQLNNPANYGTTPIDEETLCQSSGAKRCAAEFTEDGMGHPTGLPANFRTKP